MSVLEHPGQHAVGGADRQQVQRDRYSWNGQGPEGDQEQDERQDEHEGEHERGPADHKGGEVVSDGRSSADRVTDSADLAESGGQDVVS
ncbi:UNVERIFIED_ORG: hypothetical protein FHR35_000371 [Microbispora rosea subsp. rosea]